MGNFKSVNRVSTSAKNGFKGTIQAQIGPKMVEIVFAATVRSATT